MKSSLVRDAFAVLGPHPDTRAGGFVVRACHPAATSVEIRTSSGALVPMTMTRVSEGIYEGRIPDASDYRLLITYPGGMWLAIQRLEARSAPARTRMARNGMGWLRTCGTRT